MFALTLDTQGMGGLGSLILDFQRLGIGNISLYGPQGIGNHIQGLYESFNWNCPDVKCYQVSGNQSGGVIYNDEFIEVMVVGMGLRGGMFADWVSQGLAQTQKSCNSNRSSNGKCQQDFQSQAESSSGESEESSSEESSSSSSSEESDGDEAQQNQALNLKQGALGIYLQIYEFVSYSSNVDNTVRYSDC
eukprot:TRINITY_DN6308_c0_g1_i1.p1 TRINITY_DN6308_c0_g1~~TRINITY_DN6308_c0_g1_i1.p1  ORF type:complete len:217 (+),score=13.62 TRINITY_DN6308_c0_g1_i1:82-651(+)